MSRARSFARRLGACVLLVAAIVASLVGVVIPVRIGEPPLRPTSSQVQAYDRQE